MAAIGNKKDPAWRQLRKTLYAHQDRLKRKVAMENFEGIYAQSEEHILGTIKAVQMHTSEDEFAQIFAEINKTLPALSPTLEASFFNPSKQKSDQDAASSTAVRLERHWI